MDCWIRRTHWVKEILPDKNKELLVYDEYNEEDIIGEYCESDDEKF